MPPKDGAGGDVISFKCISANGIALRKSVKIDDRAGHPRGPNHGELVHGILVPGKESEWMVIKNDDGQKKKNVKDAWIGKYLPLQLRGEVVFEKIENEEKEEKRNLISNKILLVNLELLASPMLFCGI